MRGGSVHECVSQTRCGLDVRTHNQLAEQHVQHSTVSIHYRISELLSMSAAGYSDDEAQSTQGNSCGRTASRLYVHCVTTNRLTRINSPRSITTAASSTASPTSSTSPSPSPTPAPPATRNGLCSRRSHCDALRLPRIESGEHRRIAQHVRQYDQPHLTAADVDSLQLAEAALAAGGGHLGELEVHGVLCIGQQAAIEGAVGQLHCEAVAGGLVQQLLRHTHVLRHDGGDTEERAHEDDRSMSRKDEQQRGTVEGECRIERPSVWMAGDDKRRGCWGSWMQCGNVPHTNTCLGPLQLLSKYKACIVEEAEALVELKVCGTGRGSG